MSDAKTATVAKAKPENGAGVQGAAEPDPVAGPITALLASEIWPRESGIKFNTWEAVPQVGTPIDNILRPDFWANVSARMKLGDKVLVLPRDGTWYAELQVWDAGQNWVHVSPVFIQARPLFTAIPGVEAQFEIRHDPIDGVTVIRRDTGAKVKSNFANAEDARRWILSHQRALRN